MKNLNYHLLFMLLGLVYSGVVMSASTDGPKAFQGYQVPKDVERLYEEKIDGDLFVWVTTEDIPSGMLDVFKQVAERNGFDASLYCPEKTSRIAYQHFKLSVDGSEAPYMDYQGLYCLDKKGRFARLLGYDHYVHERGQAPGDQNSVANRHVAVLGIPAAYKGRTAENQYPSARILSLKDYKGSANPIDRKVFEVSWDSEKVINHPAYQSDQNLNSLFGLMLSARYVNPNITKNQVVVTFLDDRYIHTRFDVRKEDRSGLFSPPDMRVVVRAIANGKKKAEFLSTEMNAKDWKFLSFKISGSAFATARALDVATSVPGNGAK